MGYGHVCASEVLNEYFGFCTWAIKRCHFDDSFGKCGPISIILQQNSGVIVFRSLPTNPKVNELLKSVHICQSYRKNKSDTFLWPTVYICLTDLLTIQCEIHKRTSKLTATLRWTCRNARTAVDSWELRVRNLTWEQNNYDYPEKKFKCNGGAFTWLPTFDVTKLSS